jgi:hypothetical protein
MESKDSLSSSEEPATCPYTESDQSSPPPSSPRTDLFKIHLNITLQVLLGLPSSLYLSRLERNSQSVTRFKANKSYSIRSLLSTSDVWVVQISDTGHEVKKSHRGLVALGLAGYKLAVKCHLVCGDFHVFNIIKSSHSTVRHSRVLLYSRSLAKVSTNCP